MMTNAKSDIEGWIPEEVGYIYMEHTQAKTQVKIEKTSVDLLHHSCNVALSGIKTTSARFFETVLIEMYSRGAFENFMLQCVSQFFQSDKLMDVY